MQWNSDAWLWALGRTSLMVAVSAVIVAAVLSLLRVRSTTLRRATWMIVLLQGWLAVQIPIVLERQAAPAAEAVAVAEVSHPAPPVFDPAAAPLTSGVVETNGDEAPVVDPTQNPVAASPLIARTAPESQGRAIPWTGLLFLAWSTGALLTMTLGVYRYLTFVRLLRSTEPATGDWQDEFQQARVALGIEKPVELRVADDAGPCLIRRLRGSCIVAPRGLWLDLTRRQRIAILRHELAHFVRGDLWKSIAIRLLSLPQWFNPAAWWAVRRFDECAEWASDELAAGDREGATEYSKLLLALGAAPGGRAAYLPAAHRGCVSTRIRRLVAEPRRDGRVAPILVAVVAVGLLAISLLRIHVVSQPGRTAAHVAGAQPEAERPAPIPWHPDELVSVLGDEHGQTWGQPFGLTVTPDGRRLISGTSEGTLFIHDAHTMATVSTFGARRSTIWHLKVSADSGRLIVGYQDQAIELWDIEQDPPRLLQTVHLPTDDPEAIVVKYGSAQNVDRFVGCAGHQLSIWELRQSRLELIHSITAEDTTFDCLLSPDGQWLLTRSNRVSQGGEPVSPEDVFEVNGNSYIRLKCTLRVWDISGESARETDHVVTTDIESPLFGPDGATLYAKPGITELDRGQRLWSFADGKLHEEPDVPVAFSNPRAMAFSPDGSLLAGVRANSSGRVAVMDISQNPWREVASLVIQAPYLAAITFTPDGEGFMLCGGSSLQRWNRMDDGSFERVTPEPVHSGHVEDIVFSADGARLTSIGGTSICEWDLRQTAPNSVIHELNLSSSGLNGLERWTQRNALLCLLGTSGRGQGFSLLDEATDTFEELGIEFGSDYRNAAWCFAIHPDGKRLATGHWDQSIRFWNLEGDAPQMITELPRAHDGHVCDVAFSPDGTMLASGGWDHGVKLWDTSTDPPSEGGELGKHEEIVRSVAFSRDSRWLASGDEAGVIRLWDLKSADLSGPTIVHPEDVEHPKSIMDGRTINTLEFSADGRRLLSADGAGRVIVWSVPGVEIIKEWEFPGWVWTARWSPDETLIATGNDNGTVYLLAAPE